MKSLIISALILLTSFLQASYVEGASRGRAMSAPAVHHSAAAPVFWGNNVQRGNSVQQRNNAQLRDHRWNHDRNWLDPYYGLGYFTYGLDWGSYPYYTRGLASSQDDQASYGQTRLRNAEAERLELENQQTQADSAAEHRKAIVAQRAADFETGREKNIQLAHDLARLTGKVDADVGNPITIAWPTALMDARFNGYRKVVERAAALQAAGIELTDEEHRHLATSHETAIEILKNHAGEDYGFASSFVRELESRAYGYAGSFTSK